MPGLPFNLDPVPKKDDSFSWLEKYYKDVRGSSGAKQIAVGSVAGWITGYVSTKFGKIAATGIGISILLLHVANQRGYIAIDWKKLNKDVDKATKTLSKKVEKNMSTFVSKTQEVVADNILIAGGFAGGFFLGLASA